MTYYLLPLKYIPMNTAAVATPLPG